MKAPTQEKKEFEIAPSGNQIARLYSIVHIGINDEEISGETKQIDKVRFTFELPNELRSFKEGEAEKPLAMSQEYTFSMYKNSHLRALVHGILGVQLNDAEADAFDVDELLGLACMINIIHTTSKKGNVYANIASAAPLPKGMEAPAPINENFVFDVDSFTEEQFLSLPKFLQDKVASSYNYKNKVQNPNDEPFVETKKVEIESVETMDFSLRNSEESPKA